ncbi:MAG TPA: hypothetical protein VFV38_35395 [Ktedonobacteraceae bacterium]|nr:hypothetical protein [Ktedonobacteraceae bacterium]
MKTRLPTVRLPAQLDCPIMLGSHTLEQSTDGRTVVVDRQTVIRLTPIESYIFAYFVARPRTLVVSRDLSGALQANNYQDVQTQNLVRHINALRFKLRHSGLFIKRVIDCGWLLTDEVEQKTLQRRNVKR